MFYSPFNLPDTDHDGRSRKRFDVAGMDETVPSIDSHGVLLPGWFRSRLRVHHSGFRDGTLQVLGRPVRVLSPYHVHE